MESEELQVEGILVKDQTVISNKDMQEELKLKGYGEISKKEFVLAPFESLYLVYSGKLTLKKGKKIVDFDFLLELFKKNTQDILTRFLVYRDLRTRGYVVKDGFGFGTDFRVYERGHFGEKGAKYLIFALSEGQQEKISQLQKKIEQITQMGKEPIIAVIERRGEIIYYKISKINFFENKARLEDFKCE